ncbi:Ran-binding-domain-containing protein [Metschnikowia bicuspidata var. bicuspidata NRRL YB-4993]|uniref:Ran-binding-domain-containing protein n=1 Tax=Metschnikowia bicuspidata var. bicuspidata NRRL YB-4993 TaxID=869754 RepID=A0A1A0H664_9ASCO|nr:Ran-binding-domain-containing protein [Metschnikowia bicuspidata var. bicuspidata NRRL YB-4993]OBA19579.1 Ran-binding-domain-containing protein [Metschnikowia bicuspidata var. bicuspidata NRRL YB-4993]
MDEILAKASSQAVTFAIRSGISLASGFAIKKVSQLLDKIPPSEKARLEKTSARLNTKTAILATSIDLIKLSAARGNSALEATVDMVSDLKDEIDTFDAEIAAILQGFSSANEKESVRAAERKISALLDSVNDAIPLINLALITSGVSLNNAMDPRVSPSRLLQAASHVTGSNAEYARRSEGPVSVGPVFDLKLYSVFYNPSRLKYVDETSAASTEGGASAVSWKEEFARALCLIERVPGKLYEYDLVVTEDFDDGRYHDDNEAPVTRRYKVRDISKQFFSASGKLLRLEGSNSPVLTLKIQTAGAPEYVALGEVGTSFDDADSDNDDADGDPDTALINAKELQTNEKFRSLSLLEYLVRLVSLQESEQMSILEVKDEKLLLYLHDRTDKSFVPLSHEEKRRLQTKSESHGHMLQVDSSVHRLKNLSLQEDAV